MISYRLGLEEEWMRFISVLLLSLAISLDGLGVGIAYGLKGMIFPVKARLLVAAVSVCVITAAFLLGNGLRLVLSPMVGVLIGRVILFAVGFWLILQAWVNKRLRRVDRGNLPLAKVSLKSLGVVILVLQDPISADVDDSGAISLSEAFLLGLALAVDALGAGFGASLGRIYPLYTPLLVGLVKLLFLGGGLFLGGKWQKDHTRPVLDFLPGLILFFLAII